MITLLCVLTSAFVPQKFVFLDSVQATYEAGSANDLGLGQITDTGKINFFIPTFVPEKEAISTDVVLLTYKWSPHPSKARPERLHSCGSLSPPKQS